ncbi:hypothetical protein AAHC03_020624 [Spirometra sp. Aus1]
MTQWIRRLRECVTYLLLIIASPSKYPTYEPPVYELCKGEHTECTSVSYRAEDESKGSDCRLACARHRENLTENLTAYFCEKPDKPCIPYTVSGRKDYSENFERHVMCVKVCHFVGKAEHSAANSFSLCSNTMDPCAEIRKVNGSFDAFSRCAFKCDGWTNPENSRENTAFFTIQNGSLEEGKYFSNPSGGNAFAGLKNCFGTCMSASPSKYPTYEPPVYELCKGEHTECTSVSYRTEDESKGSDCRLACARHRENLTENLTAYFCEKPDKPCIPYTVSGRKDYSENFERHVMCVKVCHFVGKAEHSAANSFSLCSNTMDPCAEIKRVNGSFDAFSRCAFKCDGWTNPENSRENTAFFTIENGSLEEGKYFSNPSGGNAFASLKNCFGTCMSA